MTIVDVLIVVVVFAIMAAILWALVARLRIERSRQPPALRTSPWRLFTGITVPLRVALVALVIGSLLTNCRRTQS